ncbi:unnamed protein product, partial [Pylaiella littoralis]
QGEDEEAIRLYTRSQDVLEKHLGPAHPHVAHSLYNRAGLLYKQGKYVEAKPLYERSQAIREKVLGAEHTLMWPSRSITGGVAEKLLLCIVLYLKCICLDHTPSHFSVTFQGKYAEAERLYERLQAIREKVLCPEHLDVARSLNNQAELLRVQGKYDEAGRLYERFLRSARKYWALITRTWKIRSTTGRGC